MNIGTLKVGGRYSKEEIEAIFSTNFGARIKGITLRRDEEDRPYAIVFSRALGPYSDRLEGASFFYDGEGKDKNQILTPANKALAESNRTGRTIYGFRQDEARGGWMYLGLLEVLDYVYALKNGYLTYEFHFIIKAINPTQLVEADQAIEIMSNQEPVLTSDSHKVTVSLTARSAAFSKNVKMNYHYTCAVCRKKRFSTSGYPEVEAAHIYPKERNGSDDYRNGIALCKLHHWAFDAGLFAVSDEGKLIVKSSILNDNNYLEIHQYAGADLMLPLENHLKPHFLFLRSHRALHGF